MAVKMQFPVVNGKKKCKNCKKNFPVDEFIRNSKIRALDSYCHACRRKYSNAWHRKHRARHIIQCERWRRANRTRWDFLMWRSHVCRKYGLTKQAAEALLKNPRCGICGTDNFDGRRPNVDHSHATRKFRGLLCNKCNSALERIDNVPRWMEKATAYLKQ